MEDVLDVLADVRMELSVDEDFECLKEKKVKVCKRY